MPKKLVAAFATLFLAAGLSVVSVAPVTSAAESPPIGSPASETEPVELPTDATAPVSTTPVTCDAAEAHGALAPESTAGCTTTQECLPKSAVTYKYLPATNSGAIFVVNPDATVYSNDLCDPFWVVATSWYYTSATSVWPQIRNQVNPLPKITSVGTYNYSAEVTCGQGDIYASYAAQPEPSYNLYGPQNPFAEDFLHEMGFAGPSPTYMNQAVGCNKTPVTEPTVTRVAECGTYGSVVATDTATVDYTVTGSGGVGIYTVTAVAIAPYVLQNYPVGGWQYNLGSYTACVEKPDVTVAVGACTYNTDGTANFRTVSLTLDNSGSEKAVWFDVVNVDGYDQEVAAKTIVTIQVPDMYPGGGGFIIVAAGTTFDLPIAACDEPVKPQPTTRDEILSSYNCTTVVATVITTTYTTDWVFDTELVQWVEASEVAGAPVTTTRAMTPTEVSAEKCALAVTDPEASTCLNNPDATDFSSWIRIALDPNVEYRIDGVLATTEYTQVTPGEHTVTADALNGFTLSGGNPDAWTDVHHEWTFIAVDFGVACQPELTGSTAAGECVANAPWIFYNVTLTDPAALATSTEAHLIMADGINTEDIELGALVEDPANPGTYILSGRVLWPGAAVGPDGVTPTAWPGWEQDTDGQWVETESNFRWTRSLSQVTLSVNPQLVVDLTYPPATPDCDSNPPKDPPTLATVTPEFSFTALTCSAAGGYTLGELTPGTVQWTVNGVKTAVGSYPVTSAQTLTFVASPAVPDDGLDADWVQPQPIVFSTGSAPCDIAKLALTGISQLFALIWVGMVLGLTGVGLLLMSRRRAALGE